MENNNNGLKTPPRKDSALLLPPDTVSVQRRTSDGDYQGGRLDKSRAAVIADLRKILIVPLDGLMACINETPSVDVEKACDAIMGDADLFDKEAGQIRWKGFPRAPSKTALNEDKVFRPLVDCFKKVFANVQGCGLEFVMNGHISPLSERGCMSRPDALLIRSRSRAVESQIHWNDVVVPFEFKKDNRDTHDNEQKTIWNLHCIMREDPCRRFAFAISIEDSNLRLWLSNRAFLAASQPINFVQEVERTIRLFTFLAWASVASDMEGLGWDPTVKRLGLRPDWQYEFKVGDETFTTTRPLATYGADSLVGRATRVYEAKDSKGNTVAVKDSWRDVDRKPEGEILEDILKSCDRKLTKEEADEAKKAFVQIKLYGDVYVSDRRRDETGDPMMGTTDVLWHNIFPEQALKTKSTYQSSIGGVPKSSGVQYLTPELVLRTTGVPRRVHTRTVFSEVGVSLQQITNLKTYLSTLNDAAKALYLLHRAGWVHRDFSGGNVIRVSGRGKLGDFEYAKKVDSGDLAHEVRTGTMDFMAVEVDAHAYLFSTATKRPEGRAVFRANFLHDFESVWWAFAWVLFYHTDKTSNDNQKAKLQHDAYKTAFPGWMQTMTRHVFFTTLDTLDKACGTLCDAFQPLVDDFWSIRTALHDHYRLAEISHPKIDASPELLESAYRAVSTPLQQAVDLASDVELCSVVDIISVSKRSRTDDQLGTGPVEKKAHR